MKTSGKINRKASRFYSSLMMPRTQEAIANRNRIDLEQFFVTQIEGKL
jgi:hypothetical protein